MSAQEESSADTPVHLDLGFGQSPADSQVSIPISLSFESTIRIGRATNRIVFPTALLTFREANPALSAQIAEVDVSAEVVQDSEDVEKSILTVTLTARDGTAIPRGVLVDLIFVIPEGVTAEEIALQNFPSAASAGNGQQLSAVGTNGQVVIDERPVVYACFFYLH